VSSWTSKGSSTTREYTRLIYLISYADDLSDAGTRHGLRARCRNLILAA
jgi:hypothetical protein